MPSPIDHLADTSPCFVLVAGEASGDLLGAGLMCELRQQFPTARFAGVGGTKMIALGLDAWYPAEKLSVMGLVEVIKCLPELLMIRRDVYKKTLALKPHVFIGIDAPDFNLGLERRLKNQHIRTIHYVSPSIWAWREKRAEKIGYSADCVLCLFPMEPPIYARFAVDARFVGHPLADLFSLHTDQATARSPLGLSLDIPILALMPGSRASEIQRLSNDFIAAAILLKRKLPQLKILAPMANTSCRRAFETLFAPYANEFPKGDFYILDGKAHEAMLAADAIMLASGTATLEAMLAKRPMVVAYRLAPLTYRLIRWFKLMNVAHYSLPNVLAGAPIVPELMQEACTPEALANALLLPLQRRQIDDELATTYQRLHLLLRRNANHEAAKAVIEYVAKKNF